MSPKMFPLNVRGLAPVGRTPPGSVNAPVQLRTRFGHLGDKVAPESNGGPVRWMGPYSDEGQVYNPQAAPAGTGPAAMAAAAASPLSTNSDWQNPTTYSTIPLNAGNLNGVGNGVLQGNARRNSLIIQNQSFATAPDTAPIFYVDFNHQPLEFGSLALPPGFGFFWSASDCPPRDQIYVSLGQFVDGGGTTVIAGCIIQGTYVPVQ